MLGTTTVLISQRESCGLEMSQETGSAADLGRQKANFRARIFHLQAQALALWVLSPEYIAELTHTCSEKISAGG